MTETTAMQETGSALTRDSLIWQSLRVLQLYRLALSLTLFVLFAFSAGPQLLGSLDPRLYAIASSGYLLFMLVATPVIFLIKRPRTAWLHLPVVADLLCITLIMYASGGVLSGLGMLLLISVAGASLLLPERFALLYAASASLSLLATEVFRHLAIADGPTAYTQAGILGTALFAIAVLSTFLGARARASEALATQRGTDLANLEQVNAYVIQHMQSGVVILDAVGNIRHANEAAQRLLNLPMPEAGRLMHAPPPLFAAVAAWRRRPDEPPIAFRIPGGSSELLPKLSRIGNEQHVGTLVFLEDSAWVTQRAQEMKLATLGRLTATIAHEIRNPLAAIVHSGQLLGESEHLDSGDRRLAEIIENHAQRLNTIVDNVLQVSRREASHPRDIKLADWLRKFAREFTQGELPRRTAIEIVAKPDDLNVRVDPGQLHQVLYNLLLNARQHAADTEGKVSIRLDVYLTEGGRQACLDISDSGPGIAQETVREMFEPFYTTATQGTGLGLFIAREICEMNAATLDYVESDDGACFRIRFGNRDAMDMAV